MILVQREVSVVPFRVSISHPFFVSRNTKHSETKKLFREMSLVSRNNKNSEILFHFVLFSQKLNLVLFCKFYLFSFREFHLPLLSFIYFVVSHF
jgi:hypothetical protein